MILLALAWMLGLHAARAEFVSGSGGSDRFALVEKKAASEVFVEPDDWKAARIAANDLTLDIERVTGIKPRLKMATSGLSARAVLIGTIGRSALIDRLAASGRLDVTDIKDQWESFVIAVVRNPLPGVEQGLVIAGSGASWKTGDLKISIPSVSGEKTTSPCTETSPEKSGSPCWNASSGISARFSPNM